MNSSQQGEKGICHQASPFTSRNGWKTLGQLINLFPFFSFIWHKYPGPNPTDTRDSNLYILDTLTYTSHMSTTMASTDHARDPVPSQIDADTKTKDNTPAEANPASSDVEKQDPQMPPCCEASESRFSAFKSMGFLDRYLAIWIFLAMLIGILLGNFVEDVGPALQKGTFVDVSLPIGESSTLIPNLIRLLMWNSNWPACHDVSHPVQSRVRKAARGVQHERDLGPDGFQHRHQLDHRATPDGRPPLGTAWKGFRG